MDRDELVENLVDAHDRLQKKGGLAIYNLNRLAKAVDLFNDDEVLTLKTRVHLLELSVAVDKAIRLTEEASERIRAMNCPS